MGRKKDKTDNPYSKKPKNTALAQQRLPAWQPLLTPRFVLPALLVAGIALIPVGYVLMVNTSTVTELVVDYTGCGQMSPEGRFESQPARQRSFVPETSSIISTAATEYLGGSIGGDTSAISWSRRETGTEYLADPNDTVQRCTIQFNVPVALEPPVMLYIRLGNFLQNHRRYVKSFSYEQLIGIAMTPQDLIRSEECNPIITDDGSTQGKPIFPCGLIADSFFNDTFVSFDRLNPSGSLAQENAYQFTETGISWTSDAERYRRTTYRSEEVVPPPSWRRRYPGGKYQESGRFALPDLTTMERFQNWMRTSTFPNFRKLWGRNVTDGLAAGKYQAVIDDNFPVPENVGSRKAFIIATVGAFGGRNPLLGLIYMITGGIALLMLLLFLAKQYMHPRRLGDHTYLSWNRDSPLTPQDGGTRDRNTYEDVAGHGQSFQMSGVNKNQQHVLSG